jgi:vesicular inhibitory amino acid transporter
MRIHALGDAGGVNSLNNFARSWQRAAGFFEITPVRPGFRLESDDGRDQTDYSPSGPSSLDRPSLIRAAFDAERDQEGSDTVAVSEDRLPNEETHLLPAAAEQRLGEVRQHRSDSILSIAPSLSSPFGGSYGTSYGSLSARVNESSMMHAGRLFTENQLKAADEADVDREPLLVKQIEEDGKLINVVVGQSTLPQTIFNSVNVLVGVGLLSLPLAFKYSGWVIGMVFLAFAAAATSYTAKLLAKCLDVDSSLITFADLAYVSFGNRARIAVSVLFSLELLAACVALVVLFADSMDDLIPGWGILAWKIVCGLILIPLIFMPLRFLSFTSVLGVMCCFGSKCLGHPFHQGHLTRSSYHCGIHGRFYQTGCTGVSTATHGTVSVPSELDDCSAFLRLAHEPLGWTLRFPQYLQRHAPSIQVPKGCRHHIRLHILD